MKSSIVLLLFVQLIANCSESEWMPFARRALVPNYSINHVHLTYTLNAIFVSLNVNTMYFSFVINFTREWRERSLLLHLRFKKTFLVLTELKIPTIRIDNEPYRIDSDRWLSSLCCELCEELCHFVKSHLCNKLDL